MSGRELGLAQRARAAIAEWDMLQKGDELAVGVSGGADSVALLHFLRELAPVLALRLTAVHLNHRLRGAESDRDEAFVRALCAGWDIPLVCESADIARLAAERGLSVEECARQERYALFGQVTSANLAGTNLAGTNLAGTNLAGTNLAGTNLAGTNLAGTNLTGLGAKVATAHTLDDSAETLLLNLARGTGLRGLCGIPPVRRDAAQSGGMTVVRPLTGCSRREVEAYCAEQGLEFVTDSTNLDDHYTRNKLRHRALPVLAEVNGEYLRAMAGAMDALRADADYLDELAREARSRASTGEARWDAAALLAQPAPIRRRALLGILADHGVPPERARVERLEDVLRGGGPVRLSGEWYARRLDGALALEPADAPVEESFAPVELAYSPEGREIRVFSDKTLWVRWVDRGIFEESINYRQNQFKNALDCARIDRIMRIRQRAPGDRIRLAGRGCTKTLKKLFNEAGLSPRQRARTLVLEGENGLLWVEGFGAAESAAAGPETRRLLTLEAAGPECEEFLCHTE